MKKRSKSNEKNKQAVTNKKPQEERASTPQSLTYDTINEAVHEYLLKSGLFKTVDSFRVSFKNNELARIGFWKIHH